MKARCSSGPCAMRTESTLRSACRGRVTVLAALLFLTSLAVAAEAPVEVVGSEDPLPPLPPSAEAAQQDMIGPASTEASLDEAIFTEISALTVPEVGIALPQDQEH